MHPLPQLSAQDPAGVPSAVLHPGESYKIYCAHDILGSVSEEYTLTVERAARWCGVEEEVIYAVVERFERRFLWWKKKKDKLEGGSAESKSDVEDGEEVDGREG